MSTSRIEQLVRVQQEGLELFKRKNADYGDAFAEYGSVGVLVRMGDKITGYGLGDGTITVEIAKHSLNSFFIESKATRLNFIIK